MLSQPDCVLTNWNGTPWAAHGRAMCDKDLTWQSYSCAVRGGLKQQKAAWGIVWQRPVLFLLPLQQKCVNALVKKIWKTVFSSPFPLPCLTWDWLAVEPSVFLHCLKYWQTNCVLVRDVYQFITVGRHLIFLWQVILHFKFETLAFCIVNYFLMLCCRLAWNVLLLSLI